MMKINLLNWNNWKGGADIFTYLLAKMLKENYNIDKIVFNDASNDYDIIHNNNCFNQRNSDILTIHGINIEREDLFLNTVEKASVITSISEVQKDTLEDKYKINIDKVIYNFSDMLFYPKKIYPSYNGLIIGYFGRIEKKKIDNDFLKIIKDNKNSNIKFIFYGYWQDLKLVDYLKSFKNVEVFNMITNRKALAEAIDLVDVVIHPSLEDVCPISIIDALFRKKVVIARELETLKEVFKDNLIYYNSYVELRDVFKNIDTLKYSYLKEKAFNYAFNNFNPLENSFKYYKIYRNLLI